MPTAATRDGAGEILLRVLAGVFALSWLGLPGFGLIDLSVTLSPDPSWQGVLEAGWGLYVTAFVGVPFVAIAIRGRSRAAPAVAALYVATMALICSAVVALEVPALVLAMVLGLETVIVTGAPSRQVTRFPMRLTWQPLVIPLVLGLVPWLLYAWSMWNLNRQSRPERDITIGVDHYAVQGAYALATLMLVALAVLWPAGRVFLALIAGVAAVYLGVVSWFWYPTPGAFDRTWSGLCAVWGLAVTVLALQPRRRTSENREVAGVQRRATRR